LCGRNRVLKGIRRIWQKFYFFFIFPSQFAPPNTKYHALHVEIFSIWDRFRKDGSNMTPANILDAYADLYSGFNSDNLRHLQMMQKNDNSPPCVPPCVHQWFHILLMLSHFFYPTQFPWCSVLMMILIYHNIITQFLFYFIFAEFVAKFHYVTINSGSEFGEGFSSPKSLAEIVRRIARRIHQVPLSHRKRLKFTLKCSWTKKILRLYYEVGYGFMIMINHIQPQYFLKIVFIIWELFCISFSFICVVTVPTKKSKCPTLLYQGLIYN